MYLKWKLSLFEQKGLAQLDPVLQEPVLDLSTLCCSSTHNTLQVLQRTALGPEPSKADIVHPIQHFITMCSLLELIGKKSTGFYFLTVYFKK